MSRAILDRFLFSLRNSFAFLLVMPIPLPSPAPEGKLPAAGAHLSSCYRNELCSLLERDRERQNLLPCFFSFPNKLYPFGVLCQTELYQRSRSQCTPLSSRCWGSPNERERGTRFVMERERELRCRSRHQATLTKR